MLWDRDYKLVFYAIFMMSWFRILCRRSVIYWTFILNAACTHWQHGTRTIFTVFIALYNYYTLLKSEGSLCRKLERAPLYHWHCSTSTATSIIQCISGLEVATHVERRRYISYLHGCMDRSSVPSGCR